MHEIFRSQNVYKQYDHKEKLSRGIEFTIDYNGQWYVHGGDGPGPIKRKKLMKLFGGAGYGFMAGKGLMSLNDGHYVVKSPDGAYGVDVEDVPFIIVDYDLTGKDRLVLKTNLEETVIITATDRLYLRPEPLNKVEVLYCEVRDGLLARFSKKVFQDMADYIIAVDNGYRLDLDQFQVRIEL